MVERVIFPEKPMRVPIRIFAPDVALPPDGTLALLKQIAALEGIATSVIVLPDSHHKPHLETPSSVVSAMQDTIVLSLSSPSPGCGMALAQTTLTVEDVDDERLEVFFARLAERLNPARAQQPLSPDEMMDVLARGAAAAVSRYGFDASLLEHIEDRGDAFAAAGTVADAEAISRAVPAELRQLGQREFGLVGRGNHFLEMQVVAEVVDEGVARAWGLHEGQIVVMFHADSGRLGAYVGRLYAHRRKNTWWGRLHEWQYKFSVHVRGTRSWTEIRHRWPYFSPRRWVPIPADSEEGQRVLCALRAATNYAYANRVAVLAVVRDVMREVWGHDLPALALLWDATHNSIRREQVAGRELWVHRHNAARAVPPHDTQRQATSLPCEAGSPFARTGQPVLLPGTCRTSSYLCVADEGAERTLFSVNHGAGQTAERLAIPCDGGLTRLYSYEGELRFLLSHLSDDGLQAVVQALQADAIARPVARLRPLAVLKGSRP
ncbi:MAG: RtcB family protein [Anaerolineae bacterium]|jgi:tRNA-splicing ligase RtcB|nr:RtcB family protein [Anaerolineae bacterium]MDH7475155.1 RtcB family protein [Anaerolineae bacterium]